MANVERRLIRSLGPGKHPIALASVRPKRGVHESRRAGTRCVNASVVTAAGVHDVRLAGRGGLEPDGVP